VSRLRSEPGAGCGWNNVERRIDRDRVNEVFQKKKDKEKERKRK
jgi:hypothetical protein